MANNDTLLPLASPTLPIVAHHGPSWFITKVGEAGGWQIGVFNQLLPARRRPYIPMLIQCVNSQYRKTRTEPYLHMKI